MITRPRGGQAAIASIVLATLLAACSGGAASTPNPAPSTGSAASQAPVSSAPAAATADGGTSSGDACKIVPVDTVSQAVGYPATPVGTPAICYFQNTDKSKYLVISLFASEADMSLMLQIESGSKHVDGLGTDAFWAASGGILFVRNGTKGFELFDPDFIPATADAPVPDALTTLAKAVLANL